MTRIGRRHFMGLMGGAAALPFLPVPGWAAGQEGLADMTTDLTPIGREERGARIAKAASLMRDANIGAILIEPGATMVYFTGVQWWRSERLTAAILTAEGEVGFVTPFFEEPSVRESLGVEAEIRTWNEDEDPLELVAGWLGERGLGESRIGMEETVRFFAADGLKRALPGATIVPGAPVVRDCRMHKSPAEIALMQKANDITIAAYRHTAPRIAKGMTPSDIAAVMNKATVELGGVPQFALILLGEASAYPHGSGQPQEVREGEVVLMDCGCAVHGYQSDISRSFVFGEASQRQRLVWAQMRQGQEVALEAAQLGTPAGEVDRSVREYYAGLGWGPDYKLPGTSHRTGHGIGLDGHEPVNLVRGETTPLAPGMCFSNEPGIYIPGEFGIRLEDCFHMTETGPQWFSTPPNSIDEPFG